mgnify:FL=1
MYKLWKYYNQNRIKVWSIILAIILGFVLIKTLNINLKNKKVEDKETTSNVVSYNNESKSMVNGGSVSNKYSEDLGKFINQFFTHCIEHDPYTAYSMLSNDTKQLFYPTEELFERNYYQSKFTEDKQFSFQSWSSSNNIFIYQVKIFDNMLATGKTSDNYIEEYVTISNENGEYKLNLNSYLGKKIINKKAENNDVIIQVLKVDRYLDYEVYSLSIQNKKDKSIILDTRKKDGTCYIEDKLNNKFDALLYENKDTDFEYSPNEKKTIQIKFNDAYRSNLEIKSINFTDIIVDSDYTNNTQSQEENFRVEF